MVFVFIVGGFFVNREIINKEYSENEVFSSDKFNFNINSSYVTNRDYNNSVINYNDISYVIIRMNIVSKQGNVDFNTANLILKIGNHTYSTDARLASRFLDLGTVYNGQKFDGSRNYLFIYNIPTSEENSKMKIIYAGDKVVNLKPVYLDKNNNENKYSVGDAIDLSKSSFGYGNFKINSYEIKDKFVYPYEYVVSGKTYTSNLSISSNQNVIMHLVIDSVYPYTFDDYFVLSTYGKLKYKVGDVEYTSSIFSDKTPGTYKEGLYLAVDKNIENATNIWFEINIRNSKFIYNLK